MYYLKKPKGIQVIDKSLSISRSLAIDFNFTEYGAQRIRDNVSKSLGTFTNTPSWFRDRYGLGVDFDANTEYIKTEDLTQNQANSGQITVEIIATRDTGGSGTNYGALVFKKNGTGDTGNRVWNFENDNADAGWGMGFQYWFSSQLGIWTIPYPTAGALVHWILRYNSASTSNDPTWRQNGKPVTVTERVTPSGTARTDGRYIYIGNNATSFNSGWDGKVYLVRVWNRMLSDGEVYSLERDPNYIYRKSGLFVKAPTATSQIKVFNGVARASIKTVHPTTLATIKKLGSVANS